MLWTSNGYKGWQKLFLLIILGVVTSMHLSSASAARANLPTANEVVPGKASPLDGEYRVSSINKRVLLDRGRAIVLEGWKQFFIWDVEPGMVVIRDIQHTGNGKFTGRDLPLNGDWKATYNKSNRRLSAVVNGPYGETRYELIPVDAADQPDDVIEPEPVALRVAAERKGNAVIPVVTHCPGRQSYLSRGACWVCPTDYKRAKLTREMDHPEACEKRKSWGKGPFKKAKRKNVAGARCPSGQFHVAEKGVNGCYRCPQGYIRDKSTRNSAMCETRQG